MLRPPDREAAPAGDCSLADANEEILLLSDLFSRPLACGLSHHRQGDF